MFAGPRPVPGVLDFRAFEVAGLRLQYRRSRHDECDNLFPLVSADDCQASDVIRKLLEESHLVPVAFPFGTLHFGEIGQYTDWCFFRSAIKNSICGSKAFTSSADIFPTTLKPNAVPPLSLSLSIINAPLLVRFIYEPSIRLC